MRSWSRAGSTSGCRTCGPSCVLGTRSGSSPTARPLGISGHGGWLKPERKGEQSLQVLQDKLAEGYVFGQNGRLQLSKKLDVAWQGQVMGLYTQVRAILAEARRLRRLPVLRLAARRDFGRVE